MNDATKLDARMEALLWNQLALSKAPMTEWQALLDYLGLRLGNHLGLPLRLETLKEMEPGELGGVGLIAERLPTGGLEIELSGRLVVSNQGAEPRVYFVGFLFSQQRRLVLADHKGHTLETQYKRTDSGHGRWSAIDWVDDEFSEWARHTTPRSAFHWEGK